MFLRLKQLGDDCCLNSDDIRRFRTVGDHVIIEFRDSSAAEYDISFEALATMLRATMPESVGTKPAIHNVLISARRSRLDEEVFRFRATAFDAEKITYISTDGENHTLFTYCDEQYESDESYAAILNKITAAKGN